MVLVLPIAAAPASKSIMKKLFFHLPSIPPPRILPRRFSVYSITKASGNGNKLGDKRRSVKDKQQKQKTDSLLKRRTRSDREIDEEGFGKQFGNGGSAHVPVMLGEVLDVFASVPLKSFVDCTLGAGGHSAAIIQAHSEMEFYVGLDVDPVAHQIAQAQINSVLHKASDRRAVDLQVHTLLKNFGSIKVVLRDTGVQHAASGVDGILMDLGISSMQVNNAERGFSVLNNGPLDMRMNPQASLKAEDILNSWSASEVGRILRDYGEESNWYSLQNKIVKARMAGGLHSTGELVNLIRGSTSPIRGGRQGWIKTATRVFQALRIAVNDELNTLKEAIHSSFSSLACGGRLAVISFHSLEDRIVKQAFLDIVNCRDDAGREDRPQLTDLPKLDSYKEKETWIKQIINGSNGTILTKRPITPSEAEERLNPRSRSAKLRVIEKSRS